MTRTEALVVIEKFATWDITQKSDDPTVAGIIDGRRKLIEAAQAILVTNREELTKEELVNISRLLRILGGSGYGPDNLAAVLASRVDQVIRGS